MTAFDIKNLTERQIISPLSGEKFSLAKSLSDSAMVTGLLIHHETLLPGRRASSVHYHTKKDELIFVLSGTPSAWINGIVTKVNPGGFVAFPAGQAFAHTIINDSSPPVVFLSIGTNPQDDETIYLSEG
jgi:uncharacterized cupin superfamily protein